MGVRAVCIREKQKSLQQSVKQLLTDKINSQGLGHYFVIQKERILTQGGGMILFMGMQDHTADSIKSLEGFDVAWLEEAQRISNHSLKLLRPTMRKEGSEIWAGWNPDMPTDPIDQFFRGAEAPPNSVTVNVNWWDNPWFPSTLVDEKNYDYRRDKDKYNHVWAGGYNENSEKQVFKNWKIEEFEAPQDTTFYMGADWGFAQDPTVLIRIHIVGRTLFVDYEAYKVGCEIDHTPTLFRTVPDSHLWQIRADSARPETISYMRRHGFPKIMRSTKGAGSVKDGIEFLKSYDIVVHPRCIHLIDELMHYSYKLDRLTDEVTNLLEDKKNHVIDAFRYALEQVRRKGRTMSVGTY
ncbi:hypothetical protein MP213Fo_04340 [Pseudochrobactrum sp. MP213Fo]